ncbi:LOW QUALITY PROTEIN: coiled-coil domain-containing protein 13-like [Gigantopelta aegis]|uniref:LOW QUALITY PROTEIN: coiled-coil domain-containing protein 13-like n=1 Tax=Gigantopelta aegis TaxID=1735272 RepID=UPI001B88C8B0|nr:LOW QUALITY PROTEIN: coiled-coil domain-containing protein 13-like [Gigantopelta aegis]
MESASLKQQFEVLQEQQQKKLERRKQKKDEKEKETTTNASGAFGVDDGLNLKLADTSSSYLSQELVDHLNDQIRETKDENGRLYKLLSERDFEIRNMKRKREEEKSALGGMHVTNETAATKIIELSKKVRELTAELESEKTRVKQSQKKYYELQQQVAQSSNLQSSDTRSVLSSAVSLQSRFADEKSDDGSVDVKLLQDRLKYSESKLAEYRNQCQALKQEIKIQNKILQKELGDSVNVQSLLSTNSTWRGRAQQILTLQNKVEDLKAQLEAQQSKEAAFEDQFTGKSSARRKTQDDKYKEELKKLERERKENKERAAAELKALEEEHAALKQKIDATKARNQVLSSEMKSMKQRMSTLLEKGQNDDELIQALMKQQSQLKQLLDDSNHRHEQRMSQQQEALKEFTVKHQHDNNVVEQLRLIAADREARMRELELEIERLRANYWQMSGDCQGSLDTQLAPGGQPGPVIEDTTVTLSSVTPPASRQSERPQTVNSVINSARSTSRQSTRPESVRNGVHGDMVYQCQEYQMMMQAAQVEREKLAELVQILQKRNNEMTLKLTQIQTDLIQQRRTNVNLEKQLGKSKLQDPNSKSNLTSNNRGRKASGNTTSQDPVIPVSEVEDSQNVNIPELQANLEIQKDENDALKAALHSTLQAKDEDLRLYSATMEETKSVFLQALRQVKQRGSLTSS